MWRIIILCTVIMGIAAVNKVSYEGYKLISIVPDTYTHLKILKELKEEFGNAEYRFWQEPTFVNREVLLMVSPNNWEMFNEIMNDFNARFEIRMNNVQKLINDTSPQNQSQGFDFKSYHTLEEIYDNLEELAEKYPTKVQVIVGGTTHEGREIKGVKITSDDEKSGIFIEGGIHAREWISPATVMYILHQLLTSEDSDVKYVAENHNWFIFPVLNPDGYVFSHVTDRLWKKTRKPSSDTCIGSDPNRNWDFYWNTTGTNNDPCDDDYPGNEPFSEIEIKSISEYIKSNNHRFHSYISFHGFYQQLMFPYGYTNTRISSYDELNNVGSIAIEALKQKYNTEYVTGSVGEFHSVSGINVDYITGVLHKHIVYMYELRDKGQYGFLLPPEQIIPTGEEALDSLIAIFKTLSSGYVST